jgi:uncharacterized protein (TIGR03118 family)
MSTRQYSLFFRGITGITGAALAPLVLATASHAANVTVRVQNLVSNGTIPARTTDQTLLNPWGIAISPTAPIWIANNGTGLSTLFTPQGVRQTATVDLPMTAGGTTSTPTGVVFNTATDLTSFTVSDNGTTGPATLIFATQEGTIAAWSAVVSPPSDSSTATTVIDETVSGANFTGLTMLTSGTNSTLYAADFAHGQIDAFDENFAPIALTADAFHDPRIPANFAPFNITAVGNRLYVAFAQRNAAGDEVKGSGRGFVDVFNRNGRLVTRLVRRGKLNAPWAMVVAPSNYGAFSNALLVGNFGNGRINAFNRNTGRYLGTFRERNGDVLRIDGLWGLAFGEGGASGSTRTLYFAAGPNDEEDGVFGRITPVQSLSETAADDPTSDADDGGDAADDGGND